MDLNIRHFIGAMTLLALAAVFLLKPYHVSVSRKEGVPQVAFFDFDSYTIFPEGVRDYLKGSAAWKFGKKLMVYDPVLNRLGDQGREKVVAEEALFVINKAIELKKKVVLERDDGWRMRTPYLYYDMRMKAYTTDKAPFVITYGESIVTGRHLRYYQKSGKIKALNIHAKISRKDYEK
ncbi:MAG: LPS export ABC transporter periplasmic protein LptC [Epsilonproteobacteria bacterium]|nr:LPS export ABC transporter periplasmic protein LptC [Campylobacterota bacterium]